MNTYTKKERSSYLIGLSGQSVIYAVSYILAYYFQFTLLIPAAAVSAILTANQIWDVFVKKKVQQKGSKKCSSTQHLKSNKE